MEIKTSDDVGINKVTLGKLLKPALDFILEHEDPTDRSSLFGLCIYILKGNVKVTPITAMGTLFSAAVESNIRANDKAKLIAMMGIKAVADK